jgi:hypothetical protein
MNEGLSVFNASVLPSAYVRLWAWVEAYVVSEGRTMPPASRMINEYLDFAGKYLRSANWVNTAASIATISQQEVSPLSEQPRQAMLCTAQCKTWPTLCLSRRPLRKCGLSYQHQPQLSLVQAVRQWIRLQLLLRLLSQRLREC